MNNFKKIKIFFALSWKISPAYIFILVGNTLISSFQIFINIILPKYLIDELIGDCNINKLVLYGGAIVLFNLLFAFLEKTMKRLLDVKSIYVNEKMNQAMAQKIMNVEFAHLEDPYYLDLKERSVFALNSMGSMQNLISNITIFFKSCVTIIGLLAIMFTLSWVLVLLLVITIIITLLLYKTFMDYQAKFFQELIPVNRKYGYYVNLTYNDIMQKDIRMFHMNKMLIDKITFYNKELYRWIMTFAKKQGKFLGMYGVINDLQAAIAYGYVGLRVITDKLGPKIGLGSFTMYVSSAINFTKSTIDLGNSITIIGHMLGHLDPFMEFMSLPNESDNDGKIKLTGEIENIRFENVSFSYAKSDKIVLDNISFEINKNEKISIVGLNGAGKTTLIKLICRLYHPTSGKILINGHDIFDYDYDSYMKQVATVFQDFKLFAFSIEENITCDAQNANTDKVMELIKDVGLEEKIKSLPNGIASKFGKAYDEEGIEMSGGQGQKIAIARALYKDSSLVILDEPTSALDPLAEAEIYEHFNDLVGNKTAIYISHRMSSSVFCDKILIIDNGKVSDFDTHKNLMRKTDSLYYKLFNSQAVNYSE